MRPFPCSPMLVAALVATLTVGAAPAPVRAGPVSTGLILSGDLLVPARFDQADVEALPATSQDVSFLSGSGSQTHRFIGTSLWGLLDGAGIRTDPAVKNDLLRRYVTASATDGYRVVFSVGELHPLFGNGQSLVAYAEEVNGVPESLAEDGFARTTAPGDARGGRYVSNLERLDLRGSDAKQTGIGGGPSTAFSVAGLVQQALTLDGATLAGLGLTWQTLDVGGSSYGGYWLWDLLNSPAIGIATDPTIKNDILGMYVVATGSDGYQALFSLGELSPSFGAGPDLIALTKDGAGLGDNGFARLVVAEDGRGGRWVSNLVGLEVLRAAPAPVPATWTLLLAGALALRRMEARRGLYGRWCANLGRTLEIRP